MARNTNQRIARCLLLLMVGGGFELAGTLYLRKVYHIDEVSQRAAMPAPPTSFCWVPSAIAFLIGLPLSLVGMCNLPHDNPTSDNRGRKFYSEARNDPSEHEG